MTTLRALFIALLACAFLTTGGGSVFAQGGRNAINGVVMNAKGEPLNRLRVELQNEVEMFVAYTYTDATGRYQFQNLSQGTFIIKVHSDGKYIGQASRVVLQAIRTGTAHYEQVDFALKEIPVRRDSTISSNTGTTFVQEIPENARKIFERAIKQFEVEKESSKGLESLREAIRLFPNYYNALERLGIELVRLQQYDEARSLLAQAVKINRAGAPALYGLGVSEFHLQHTAEAIEALRQSIVIAPDSSNSAFEHFYLGLAYWRLNKHSDAEPHLKKAGELGGTNIPPDIHMYLAQYYSESGRSREAADELELFLKLVPNAKDAEKIRNLVRQLRAKSAGQ